MRDFQKQKVYDAEGTVRGMFDYAAQYGAPVDAYGISITLPPEAKFSSAGDVQRYCNRVCHLIGAPPVHVRARKGSSVAHYEPCGCVIAVPEHGTRWALREIVVLHELAHHVSPLGAHHGPEFVNNFIDLVGRVMGPEAGLLCRVVYDKQGVVTRQGASA